VHGIITGEARVAEASADGGSGFLQAVKTQVLEAVGADVLLDLFTLHLRGDQLAPVAGVDAVEARPLDRWRSDAQMNLERAGFAEHLHQLSLCRAAHDRVVDDNQALPRDVLAQWVELHPHSGLALLLTRCDEAAADVSVLHEPL